MKMQNFFTIKSMNVGNGNTVNSELEDGNKYYDISRDDPSIPLLWKGKAKQTWAEQRILETMLFTISDSDSDGRFPPS